MYVGGYMYEGDTCMWGTHVCGGHMYEGDTCMRGTHVHVCGGTHV